MSHKTLVTGETLDHLFILFLKILEVDTIFKTYFQTNEKKRKLVNGGDLILGNQLVLFFFFLKKMFWSNFRFMAKL